MIDYPALVNDFSVKSPHLVPEGMPVPFDRVHGTDNTPEKLTEKRYMHPADPDFCPGRRLIFERSVWKFAL
jgi:hypothetical protein